MSVFWTRKMKTYFRSIDVDNDKTMTKNDFVEFGRKFAEHHKLDEEHGNTVKSQIMEIWSTFTNGKLDTILTEDQFVELMKTLRSDPTFLESTNGTLEIIFKVVDANGDGGIQLDEVISLFEVLGLDTSKAPISFQALDVNGDGVISIEELIENGLAFFTSEDESHRSQFFWGPLV